jgi:hypothetical protein
MSVINSTASASGITLGNDSSGTLFIQTGGTSYITLPQTGAIGLGSSGSTGTPGQVLTSSGSGAAPVWGQQSATIGKALGIELTFGWFK